MKAGTLNNIITIQRQTQDSDALGQPLNVWVDVCTVHANVKHQRGAEAIRADVIRSDVQASIRIRFRRDIDNGMRVLCGDAVYNIQAVLPDLASREHIDLVCELVR